jgi:hypothetical protein
MILFKVCAWRLKDIPDAVAIAERHRGRLDLEYLRKWAALLTAKNPTHLGEVQVRLEAVLTNGPLPPAAHGQHQG